MVLRPFIQKGVIGTLRDFSNISMNHHHGMQSEELAGLNSDLDRDGIVNELTEGDITAVTIFQATLDFPDNIFSENEEIKSAQLKGKEIFKEIIRVASGKHSKSEKLGFGEVEFVPWQIGSVM